MKILALDLGKFNSVACIYDTAKLAHRFVTVPTTKKGLQDLFVEEAADRIVIEICSISGWVVDLIRELKFAFPSSARRCARAN